MYSAQAKYLSKAFFSSYGDINYVTKNISILEKQSHPDSYRGMSCYQYHKA